MPISEAIREPRTREEISRLGGSGLRQFLRDPQFGAVLRRFLRLPAAGRALHPMELSTISASTRRNSWPVRAHPHHRRQGLLCELPGAAPRRAARENQPCAGRAGRCTTMPRSSIRRSRTGTRAMPRAAVASSLRDQARRLPRPQLQDLLDPGGSQLGDHLEIPRAASCAATIPAASSIPSRFPTAASRSFRHQDDPSRPQHHDRIISKGHRRRALQQHLSRARLGTSPRRRRAQLHQLRLAPDRRQIARPHVPYIEAKTRRPCSSTRRPPPRFPRRRCSYCMQRGLSREAVALVVNGFVRDVLQQLPMEFAVEAQKLISTASKGRWADSLPAQAQALG